MKNILTKKPSNLISSHARPSSKRYCHKHNGSRVKHEYSIGLLIGRGETTYLRLRIKTQASYFFNAGSNCETKALS